MTPDTFFDNFAFLADAPNSIQKLRELILQLAVQGKLVPQDPEDEPATLLLKKLKTSQETAGKEKQFVGIKKQQAVSYDSCSFTLPKGWVWCKLGDIIQVSSGDALPSHRMTKDGRVPVYGGNGVTGYHHEGNIYESTLVIGRVGFYCGSVHLTPQLAWITDNAFITRFSKQCIDQQFLFWLLKATDLRANDSATAQPVISGRKIYPIIIGLPPLNEQIRIAAMIDRLMPFCDDLEAKQQKRSEARERLVNTLIDKLLASRESAEFDEHWQRLCDHFDLLYDTPDSIGKLRQAILQLAVQGKLVPQDLKDEPASMLLKKINAKKENLIKEGKRKKTEVVSTLKEEEQPFVASPIWQWARFGEIADIASGVTLGRQLGGKQTVSYPYLRVANVQRGYLDLRKIKEVEILVGELDKYQLRKGDILLTEGGDWDKLGRAAIWEDQIPNCLHQNHIFRARPLVGEIQPRWIILYMNSSTGQRYFQDASKQTTNLASINMTQLRSCPIPIPPSRTQKQILAKVDQLMAFCDELEAKLKQAQTSSEKLATAMTQSLLAA